MSELQGMVRLYRESHHRIAEMVALGCTPSKIRQDLGVSLRRLTLLMADPTFQELIASKSAKIEEKIEKEMDLYAQTAVANMLQAEFAVQDAITEHTDDPDGHKLSVMALNRIAMDRADRFGYGKNSTLKVEHDLGGMLDRAIARSGMGPKVIDVKPLPELLSPPPPAPEVVEEKTAPVPTERFPRQPPERVSLSDALRKRRVA